MKKWLSALPALVWLILLAACIQTQPMPRSPGATRATDVERPTQVIAYDLGEITLLQKQFPLDSPFRNMPARLRGMIGVPGGQGPHPVVLLLHGSHQICSDSEVWPCAPDGERPNYTGFTYLVEALAKAGYVALSIDVNAEYTFAFGEAPPTMRITQLIDAHLKGLAAANAGESQEFGVDLIGRVDLSRMMWMGHSRGGDYANWIVRRHNLGESASPAGYGPVQGLILMAPSVFSPEALPTVDLPVAVILPACDSDVVLLDGQRYYESARFDLARTQPVTSVYLAGGNHENSNSILAGGTILADRPDCAAGAALTPEAQQDFMVHYMLKFLQWLYADPHQRSDAAQTLGLDPRTAPPTQIFDGPVQVNTVFPPADHVRIIVPDSDAEVHTNLLGGAVRMDGVTVVFCPQDYYTPDMEPGKEACGRVYFNQPGYPQQFVLRWEAPGAAWRAVLPVSAGDLSGYAGLSLRAALNPLSDLNRQDARQAFSVVLSDQNGAHASIIVPDLPYPAGTRIPSDTFEGDSFNGHVYMKAVNLPLSGFPGIDLARIAEIALIFDQRDSGELFIADLMLTR